MREIVICDYDPNWVARFEREHDLLTAALASFSPIIEHIGSTSVPNLAAKPVIDIMIGIPLEERLNELIEPIEALGYEYVQKYESDMPFRRFFRKETSGIRSHHIHAVAIMGNFWRRHLAFRDWLRSHSEDAHAYEALKRQLCIRYRFDSDRYTDAKSDFIEGILDVAFSNTKTAA